MRRLAAVALPVGVGGEADGRVERESGLTRAEACGLSGSDALQALQRVDHAAKPSTLKSSIATAYVVHVISRVRGSTPQSAIDEALERAERRFEEDRLALVDARHVRAERLHERDQERQHEM